MVKVVGFWSRVGLRLGIKLEYLQIIIKCKYFKGNYNAPTCMCTIL